MFYLRYPMNTELRFATAGRFTAHNNPLHPHRNLPSAVLLIGLSGSYPIAQDDREFVLCENSFLLLFPGHEHRGYAPATDAQSHYWCHFHFPQSSAPYADDCKECSEFLPVVVEDPDITLPENRKFCYLPEAGMLTYPDKFHILFRQLIDASQNSYPSKEARDIICSSYITIILNELTQQTLEGALIRQIEEISGSRQAAVIARVKEYLRASLCDTTLSIPALARQFHYHPNYLSQIFRAETGMTMTRYLNAVRLEKAGTLLLNSDLHIDMIAAECGFNDEKYFMKAFKRSYGVTPTEYRNVYFRLHDNRT